jgi:hypothetical protein
MFEEELKKKLLESELIMNQEPLTGHADRFETRLMQRREIVMKSRFRTRFVLVSVAAASICLIVIAVSVFKISKQNEESQLAQVNEEMEVPAELSEVKGFYKKRYESNKMDVSAGDATVQKFLYNLHYLESQYVVLENAYQSNRDDQKIVMAMVENYRYRLQVIEMMQKYIQIKNNPTHENNTDL